MKEKQFEPAESNHVAPAPGIASVDTHNPDETSSKESHNQHFNEKNEKEQTGKKSTGQNGE